MQPGGVSANDTHSVTQGAEVSCVAAHGHAARRRLSVRYPKRSMLRRESRPGRADRHRRRGSELIEHLARGPRPCQPKGGAHESLRVYVLEEGEERTVVAVRVEQPDGLLVQPELTPGDRLG